MASKKAQVDSGLTTDGKGRPTGGAIFWMNRELEEKKRLYGKKG
jgi:hypothetical protein